GITAAVPEPSSYAMLAAGLTVVGVIARRRRKAA
ncbi:MAG: PEP-CTERM sorting domain-containing protein, partial [Rubrivivax sp.]